MQMAHSRPLSKHKKWVVTEILKKERVYDHDNVGKNAQVLDPGDARRFDAKAAGGSSAGEKELEKEKEAAAAAAASAASSADAEAGGVGTGAGGDTEGGRGGGGGGGGAGDDDMEAPAFGAAPQVIGVPTKPKYASFRGFASAIWGFSS